MRPTSRIDSAGRPVRGLLRGGNLPRCRAMLTPVLSMALALSLSLLLAMPAWAMTLEEAARKVAREHNARVLSAKTVTRQGERIHEIKVVTRDGVVKTVRVPEND